MLCAPPSTRMARPGKRTALWGGGLLLAVGLFLLFADFIIPPGSGGGLGAIVLLVYSLFALTALGVLLLLIGCILLWRSRPSKDSA